jgi:hypothetical protein
VFTVNMIELERLSLSTLDPQAPKSFPVGRQKLFRRHAAVLGASVNDSCPFGRESGSHRAIRHRAKDIERSEARRHVRVKTTHEEGLTGNSPPPGFGVPTDVASGDVP